MIAPAIGAALVLRFEFAERLAAHCAEAGMGQGIICLNPFKAVVSIGEQGCCNLCCAAM
jgi:hypothetical protein